MHAVGAAGFTRALEAEYQQFFCRYSDPSYIKSVKLEILTAITTEVKRTDNLTDRGRETDRDTKAETERGRDRDRDTETEARGSRGARRDPIGGQSDDFFFSFFAQLTARSIIQGSLFIVSLVFIVYC